MKKFFLFAFATTVALSAFAKSKSGITKKALDRDNAHVAARTTSTGDTAEMFNFIPGTDTATIYVVGHNADSGYVTGTDAYGDQGYAERFDPYDTLVSVLGVVTEFTGTVNPASTKTITLNTWTVGARTNAGFPSGMVYNSGFPNTSIASMSVPVTHLGIATVAGASDTAKTFWFPTPSSYVASFFVGYTINYTFSALNGDTLGMLTSQDGERHVPIYTVSGSDTIINNVNATMYDDNTWHDDATDNFAIANHMLIFPIVKIGGPNGVHGITKNNFTFYGNYPNPATTETNIKFSLAQATDVTITVTDLSGKVIKSVKNSYNSGTQVVTLNTDNMPAGEYVYTVRTAQGEGFASKLTVIK